jgi:phage gp46-like protein
MTDIRIVTNYSFTLTPVITMDWLLTPMGSLDEAQELATAVKVALATDGLAYQDDQLPGLEDDTDRAGWWGDLQAPQIWNGWPIGSRLWLLRRSSITDSASRLGSTLERAERYTQEALQPFVEQKICSTFEVVASRLTSQEIVVQVTIFRGPLPAIQLQFQALWDEITEP